MLSILDGVYSDQTRVLHDATKLLNSAEGSGLMPEILPVAERKGHINVYHSKSLCFSGCIPMTYNGIKYQIPIQIFLTPSYPSYPPICYVRPLETMVIKENHKHVGSDGMIYMPYLNQWNNNSNLVDMVLMMSSIFGADPPVFAKAAKTYNAVTM